MTYALISDYTNLCSDLTYVLLSCTTIYFSLYVFMFVYVPAYVFKCEYTHFI